MTAVHIAVDAMGGDLGPRIVVSACYAALLRNPSLTLHLVGEQQQLMALLGDLPAALKPRLHLFPASETIAMDDAPSRVLRGKPDASMRLALQLVRDGQAQACVSAGNTGALMALSRQVLGVVSGIDRPAIMTAMPSLRGSVQLLDLGANVDATAAQLVQFALMGSLARELAGKAMPAVALLNVGTESIKGSLAVRQAAALLELLPGINYQGYIEADAVFRGEADVVVCDGFVGNVLLKGAEGVARMMAAQLKEHVLRTAWRRLLALLGRGLWRDLSAIWSPDGYNGAMLLGVAGLVVKSHGAAGEQAFLAALERAMQMAPEQLPLRLEQRLREQALPISLFNL